MAEIIIDGIKITDMAEANAYAAQGFINQKELTEASKVLDSGRLDLMELSKMQRRNLRKPVLVYIAEKLGWKK